MPFDVDGALKAGYSPDEVSDYLKSQPDTGFDFDGARKAGYSSAEILDFIKAKPQETPTATDSTGDAQYDPMGNVISGAAPTSGADTGQKSLLESTAAVPGELAKGAGGYMNKAAQAVNKVGFAVPLALDKITSMATGTDTDQFKAWWVDHMITPLQQNESAFTPDEHARMPERIANSLGQTSQMLASVITTAPEAIAMAPSELANLTATKILGTAADHAARAAMIPGLTDAAEVMQKVYDKTGGDVQKTATAGAATYLTTAANFMIPGSVDGNIASRIAKVAPAMTIGGEASRVAMNQVLPDDMQRQFDPEQAGESLVTNSLFGVMGHPEDHTSEMAAAARETYPTPADVLKAPDVDTAIKTAQASVDGAVDVAAKLRAIRPLEPAAEGPMQKALREAQARATEQVDTSAPEQAVAPAVEPAVPDVAETESPVAPVTEQNQKDALGQLSDIAIQQVGDVGPGGDITQGMVPPADWRVLEDAGLVQDMESPTGERYRGVPALAFGAERDRRMALERAQQKPASNEDKATAIERRAQNYERVAQQKIDAGFPEDAADYSEKAKALRDQAAGVRTATEPNPPITEESPAAQPGGTTDQEPARAYTKVQAQFYAKRMNGQGLASEVVPHPTEAGKFAIVPAGQGEEDATAERGTVGTATDAGADSGQRGEADDEPADQRGSGILSGDAGIHQNGNGLLPELASQEIHHPAPPSEGRVVSGLGTRDKLRAIAKNIGVMPNETTGGWYHAGGSEVTIPPEDHTAEGAVSADHVFAHELGHAAMQERGISYKGFPVSELKKQIPNWNELVAASKNFRPGVWAHESDQVKQHARKPNEVIADAIGSVLMGHNDFSLLRGLPLTERDVGLKAREAGNDKAIEPEAQILGKPASTVSDGALSALAKSKTAAAGPARDEVARRERSTPLNDPRLQDEAVRAALKTMPADAGWSQVGGRLVRTAHSEVSGDETISRTTWIPHAEWFTAGLGGVKQIQTAVDNALAGQKLGAQQKRIVLHMLDYLHDQMHPELDKFDTNTLADAGVLDNTDPERASLEALFAASEEKEHTGADHEAFAKAINDEEIGNPYDTEAEPGAGTTEGAPAGESQEGRTPVPAAHGSEEGFGLESQTREDLAARDAQTQAAEAQRLKDERAAEDKRRADAERSSFSLTGSDRQADANPDQADIFSQPKAEAPKTKEARAVAQADAIEPAKPDVPTDPITRDQQVQAKGQEARIQDFGEKIGGARKDTAKPLGTRSRIEKEDETQPAWFRKYHAMQNIRTGKWDLNKESGGPRGSTNSVKRGFDTEQEAINAIPLVEVSRNHRVYSYDTGKAGNAEESARTADAWLKQVSEKVAALRNDNAGLLINASVTNRLQKSLREGLITQEQYDAAKAKGTALSDVDMAKAADIERQINEAREMPMATPAGKKWGIFRNITDRKRVMVKAGFDSHEDAMKEMATRPVPIIEHKFSFPERPWLDRIERTGTERRTEDVTPKQFQDQFGFRAGEFGNWNMGGDGQAALNHAFDALHDLAETLGVPPKALSLNGELAIAFGARGTGGKNAAAAHYEPGYGVINMTKIKGAGSLAHEWWHAVDHYFAKSGGWRNSSSVVEGGFRHDSAARPELVKAIQHVVDTIMHAEKSKTTDADLVRANAQKRVDGARRDLDNKLTYLRQSLSDNQYRNKKTLASADQLKKWDALVEKLRNGDGGEKINIEPSAQSKRANKFAMGFESMSNIRDLNDMAKEITGRGFLRADQDSYGRQMYWIVKSIAENKEKVNAQQDETTTYKGRTDYYLEAKKIDDYRTGDYWSMPEEMGARAFESYIFDKMSGDAKRSDYLVYGVENRHYAALEMKPYPEGEERQRIDAAFDSLFKTVQTKETDKGTALFSRGNGSGSIDRSTLQRSLSEAFGERAAGRLLDTGILTPIDKQTDAPSHVIPFMREGDVIKGFYDPRTDRTYAVLENLKPEDVKGLALHEVGIHYGFKGMLGDQKYAQVMKRLDFLRRGGNRDVNAAFVQASREAAAEHQIPEETLAYLVQNRPDLPLVRDVISSVRAFMFRQFGMLGKSLTVDDISTLAKASVMKARLRTEAEAAPQFARNSDEPRDIPERDRTNIDTAKRRLGKFVDEFVGGRMKDSDEQLLGQTPAVLRALGAPALDMHIDGSTIKKVLGGKHQYEITPEMLKQVPEGLYDPLMVFDDPSARGEPGKFVVTELKARNGSPVIVAVHLEKQAQRAVVNDIASVYGWDDAISRSKKMEGSLEYIRNEESLRSSTFFAALDWANKVQLTESSGKRILTEADVVKEQGPSFSRAAAGADEDSTEKAAVAANSRMAKFLQRPKEFVSDLKLMTIPMAEGSDLARAAAKRYANQERLAQSQWRRFDDILTKEFTEDQRKKMWEAADEENDLRRDKIEDPARGLGRLDPKEREAMDVLHQYGEALMKRAQDNEMFRGEGVPYWAPRMAVMIGDDGTYSRPSSGDPAGGSSDGKNISTYASSLRERKYLTSAETEAAMKARLDNGDKTAVLVKDVRTMPLAMARLEKAVAARELINQVKALGRATGEDLVNSSGGPNHFTLDHPAFQTFRPRFEEQDGKMVPATDSKGEMLFDKVPIYIRNDWKGPLKSVMTTKPGAAYLGMMALKSKSMGLIMYSPVIHNAVEWGRALPAMDWKGKMSLGLYTYVTGHKAKQNPEVMREAIMHGLVPIGGRGAMQDITGIMEDPELKAGRSWTAKATGAAVSLISEPAGQKVMKAIDTAGKFWHETLLWNRVADLQMGLYTSMKTSLLNKGLPEDSASWVAAHFANRFAGALPREAMSDGAQKLLNLSLFSRTFTMGNLGVMKDMIGGLPKDVQASIRLHANEVAAKAAVSEGRRIAIGAFAVDIALSYIGASMVQDWMKHLHEDKSWGALIDGYKERFGDLAERLKTDPVSVFAHPFDSIESLSSTSTNEPGKEDRIRIGEEEDGTAIYMRLPTGKIGEEFVKYVSPFDEKKGTVSQLRAKESTFLKPIDQLTTNDANSFGKKIYSKDYGLRKNIGNVLWTIFKAQLPTDQLIAAYDLAKGKGDDMDARKIVGPLIGLTYSKGAPGGPELGAIYDADQSYRDKVNGVRDDVKRLLKYGEEDKAIELMENADMTQKDINRMIQNFEDPGRRLSPSAIRKFNEKSTDEQKARMDRMSR